ncbi:ribonuclease HII [Liquorilactobacillus oeni]|uniref:Ribonuclease HII n=1 Tax=Liquorilactobacillus oeni DSM 19972 TaxID=1423777 RepID=A0A0R1M8W9_9LACO|nr:ribonuclease HII [Liquorilactobacillus oeni]KRL04369.1 ribonuclease HII [Liquorilactobacillus oeni DSM 19972]
MVNVKLTIAEVKEKLTQEPSAAFLTQLKTDSRKGVQQQLVCYTKKKLKAAQRVKAFKKRFEYERSFWKQGYRLVAGIDEVGRGPLAGPVVAAAVILPHDFDLIEVNDSKTLSVSKREELYDKILNQALAVAVGTVSNQMIDQINIYQATRVAMLHAVEALRIQPQQLIIDAMQIDSQLPQLRLVKADSKSISVAAASIVAKVCRDHLMSFYDRIYPEYDFRHNDGYGTPKHLQAVAKYGITPLHRKTFEPLRSHFL